MGLNQGMNMGMGMPGMGLGVQQQQRLTPDGYGISPTAPSDFTGVGNLNLDYRESRGSTSSFGEGRNRRLGGQKRSWDSHSNSNSNRAERPAKLPRLGSPSSSSNPSKLPIASGPPPRIEGTNIKLETAEEIEKWREERRKKFPTAERRQQAEEERKLKEASMPENGLNSRTRGRGRGRGRGDRGRGRGRGGKVSATEADEKKEQPTESSMDQEQMKPPASGLADALVISSSSDSDSSSSSEDEDETKPVDTKNILQSDIKPPNLAVDSNPEQGKKVCRNFVKGRCRFGKRCKYLHQKPAASKTATATKTVKPVASHQVVKPPSLLNKLMDREISHDIKDAIAVIDFLAANGWLEKVERRPGEARKKMIEVLKEEREDISERLVMAGGGEDVTGEMEE
ncbi:hypothetical protein BT69DRAFT_1280532 [Atractiella rhizophila]|nr:hypothetical protein BT69DRAFT_1280532 [Atractiella rhizophila]